jgi:hypothetical protein
LFKFFNRFSGKFAVRDFSAHNPAKIGNREWKTENRELKCLAFTQIQNNYRMT